MQWLRRLQASFISFLAILVLQAFAPGTAQAGVSVHGADLSARLAKTPIFQFDSLCRANQYFVGSHLQTQPTPPGCVLPGVIGLSGTTLTFSSKSGVVIDLAHLRNAAGGEQPAQPDSFYRIEVTIEDRGQQDTQMAIMALDSLWAAPTQGGPKGMTAGVTMSQRTYWFLHSGFGPLDPGSKDFLERFVVLKRAPGTWTAPRDVKVELYVTPNGTYAMINGVNLGTLPQLAAGSFTSYQPVRYLVLAKMDSGSSQVFFKDIRVTDLDNMTSMNGAHEVNAHFIREAMADTALLNEYSNPGASSFANALWAAFLYRGHDFYFKTHSVLKVRELVDTYLAHLPAYIDRAAAAFNNATRGDPSRPYECQLTWANHEYTNNLQWHLTAVYALSSYLRRDQLEKLQSEFSRFADATARRISPDGTFPLKSPLSCPAFDGHPAVDFGTYVGDTYAEELVWLVSLYAGYLANFPYDDTPFSSPSASGPRSAVLKEYLTFLSYHTLADGTSLADRFGGGFRFQHLRTPWNDYEAWPMTMYGGRATRYIHPDALIDNHGFHPSIHYALGVLNILVYRNILLQAGLDAKDVTLQAMLHNVDAGYQANLEARLLLPDGAGHQTFRHKAPVPHQGALKTDVLGPPDPVTGDIHSFFALTNPSLLEDWASNFTAYNTLENHLRAGSGSPRGETLVDNYIRALYYSHYTGNGLLFCVPFSSCSAPRQLFPDALYAMAFTQRGSYDARGPLCEEPAALQLTWSGTATWACDNTVRSEGAESIRLSSTTGSDAEAYSPLIRVSPNQPYHISYEVKTENLGGVGPTPATVYGRLVAAQYTSAATERDSITQNRVDNGFSLGEPSLGGTRGWTHRSYSFQSTGSTAYLRLRAPLGMNGQASGRVWFDNIRICEEALYYARVWSGDFSWSCDMSTRRVGETSLKLQADQLTDGEAGSPLIAVKPLKRYEVSYWVKTRSLVPGGTNPADTYGVVIPAQYSEEALETSAVTEHRINPGWGMGINLGGTSDWVYRRYTFTTDEKTRYVRLRAALGLQGTTTGSVWFEQVTLSELP